MARFALIHSASERVVQIAPQQFLVHHDLQWIDVSARSEDDATLLNSNYVNGKLIIKPLEPPFVIPEQLTEGVEAERA